MGAIPVLFDAAQLEMFPFQHALNPAEFTAFVPRALAASDGFNVVDYLGAAYPLRQRRRMLERLHGVRHALLYALEPLQARPTHPTLYYPTLQAGPAGAKPVP